MQTFNLKILTPTGSLYEGETYRVVLPTTTGEISVLHGHTPLISTISVGELRIENKQGEVSKYLVQGGVLDVKDSKDAKGSDVVILVERTFEEGSSEGLDKELERAKEAMQMKKEEYDFAEEEATIERSLFLKRRNK